MARRPARDPLRRLSLVGSSLWEGWSIEPPWTLIAAYTSAAQCSPSAFPVHPTFDAAAAGLQHPRVHLGARLREQLVPAQVGVVARGDEVVAQGLLHVLVHLPVQGVGHLARRAAHEAGEAWGHGDTSATRKPKNPPKAGQ